MAPDPTPVTEPFPISHIAGRYLLFDINAISHARRHHNICGVLIGTLPNLSQQNVFLGIPLELMPEEARVLVERGHAYIVDDVRAHRKGCLEMSRDERLKYLREMDRQGLEFAKGVREKAEERAERALREKGLVGRRGKEESEAPQESADAEGVSTSNSLLDSTPSTSPSVAVPEKKLEPHFITPTTSYPPLSPPSTDAALPLPSVPKSYPLFRYLNSRGYFAMPGLRFGCNYSVYPGDPLRFHSHFLATGLDWDEEFELLDIVGGGRLGTGVKKAYLIGGEDPEATPAEEEEQDGASAKPVRAFSIEWAGF
ncbi:SEN34 subunit of tRNA-splicing endonuclease [Trematosphaeria pertusa]|uniref:tRNA-splicing endonuclease subunit Sen34 n=1 Tax=Trematosphaeria pertusa TaxID=390896 RepID=A0A6A6IF31_9PLEO|nr:SEN34 subunit of tRNA-splicing endonuclease [Trematosphaeria pertusa]KAF2248807.1 SEN34 subunit of tRNA-splicing endonuclease [Trematosphaeria pertusa]